MNPWLHRQIGEVVILDNRDSFVFNLAHRFHEVQLETVVVRSDALDLDTLRDWEPRALVISPGPGHPRDAAISVATVAHFSGRIPILGVCLGHQAIVVAHGGRVARNDAPCHGMATAVRHDGSALFDGIPQEFPAGRYHSLSAIAPVPAPLRVTAVGSGQVMAVEHVEHPTFGVQFHPESVLTPHGTLLLKNFARLVDRWSTGS